MREIKCYSFDGLQEGKTFKNGLLQAGFKVYPPGDSGSRKPLIADIRVEGKPQAVGYFDEMDWPRMLYLPDYDNRLTREYIPAFLQPSTSDSQPPSEAGRVAHNSVT
ncbi:MAG: hypothetical protein ISS93_00720 [Candidatus Aenigmarchaeota archaeon]|nr:hypothetical protein [Candidatus Aenigmarchaeota archaeon]